MKREVFTARAVPTKAEALLHSELARRVIGSMPSLNDTLPFKEDDGTTKLFRSIDKQRRKKATDSVPEQTLSAYLAEPDPLDD